MSNKEVNEKIYTEFGAFEDEHFWEPLFATGELPESMRNIIDEPKDGSVGLSLWRAYKWAELQNEARARETSKVGKYGLIVVKKRVVVERPWIPVTIEEIEAVRRT